MSNGFWFYGNKGILNFPKGVSCETKCLEEAPLEQISIRQTADQIEQEIQRREK